MIVFLSVDRRGGPEGPRYGEGQREAAGEGELPEDLSHQAGSLPARRPAPVRRRFGRWSGGLWGEPGSRSPSSASAGREIRYEGASLKSVEALLGGALDAGLDLIDTAECYFESERLIGRAVGHRRREFGLLTKCGHDQGIGLPEWTPRLVEASVERSLRLLRTDRVDLLQLHSCDEEVLRRANVVTVGAGDWNLSPEVIAEVEALLAERERTLA